ncbi:Uma2 family endonuclease [Actinoplanes sp. NPDC051861]|uniref:Uma2 family endonuclease n=1 Tax=Actinoplanes sp. NPDC051861 TaxID=3155170 RepID=UPI0034150B66
MTARHEETNSPCPPAHSTNWPCPPAQGYYAEDLDRLPGLPPHTELIDGTLVLPGPQQPFQTEVLSQLEAAMIRLTPADDFTVVRQKSVLLGRRSRPEPDLMLVKANVELAKDATYYPPHAVTLVAEVVTPDSEARDRDRKPHIYAAAGFEYFWRLEEVAGKIILYTYELNKMSHHYMLLGIFQGRVRLARPFPIDIDLNDLLTSHSHSHSHSRSRTARNLGPALQLLPV